jgi:hypothetical protein
MITADWRQTWAAEVCSYQGENKESIDDIIYRWKACNVPYTAVVATSILLHSSSIERATNQRVDAVKISNRSIFQRGKALVKSICQGHVIYHSIACFFVWPEFRKLQAQSTGRRRSLSAQYASSTPRSSSWALASASLTGSRTVRIAGNMAGGKDLIECTSYYSDLVSNLSPVSAVRNLLLTYLKPLVYGDIIMSLPDLNSLKLFQHSDYLTLYLITIF